MRLINVSALALVSACGLGACAHLASSSKQPSVPSAVGKNPPAVATVVDEERLTSNTMEALIGYTESVHLLSPDNLQREYQRVEQAYSGEPSPSNRLKLAILLGLRNAPFRDEARARGLLLQSLNDSGYNASTYRPLAGLLLVHLDERRELERNWDEERRQRIALNKKLEQLRTIEEEIDRRRAPPSVIPQRNGSSRSDTGS